MLHQDKQTTNNNSSSGTSLTVTKQGPAGKVMAGGFIHTALVTVQNSNSDHKITARAALDSCSSHSLLSEAMASFLALKREPLDVTISGAVAQQQSNTVPQFKFPQSTHLLSTFQLKLP